MRISTRMQRVCDSVSRLNSAMISHMTRIAWQTLRPISLGAWAILVNGNMSRLDDEGSSKFEDQACYLERVYLMWLTAYEGDVSRNQGFT